MESMQLNTMTPLHKAPKQVPILELGMHSLGSYSLRSYSLGSYSLQSGILQARATNFGARGALSCSSRRHIEDPETQALFKEKMTRMDTYGHMHTYGYNWGPNSQALAQNWRRARMSPYGHLYPCVYLYVIYIYISIYI